MKGFYIASVTFNISKINVMMENTELLKLDTLVGISQDEQISIIGRIIDFCFSKKDQNGMLHAFKLAETIDYELLTQHNKINYHYNLSNGWHDIIAFNYNDRKYVWDFQQPELTNVIFHLRKAISIEGFETIELGRKLQVFTNLGNTLSQIGRFIEAQAAWNKAIELHPDFAMALANKGYGMKYYCDCLFDENHQKIFLNFTYYFLNEGLKRKGLLEVDSIDFFTSARNSLNSAVPEKFRDKLPDLNDYPLGDEKDLVNYRKWCLNNTLYINPLNDLGNFNIASHDCLNLSSIIFEGNEPPTYHTLYNQIKQEFGTARFMYYESIQGKNPHFSDKDIVILETNELAKYSYYLELLKISFRMAYSTFDKIAYLLNDYLELGIAEHEISFRKLWFEKTSKSQEKKLRTFFQNSENLSLRGLFWLSKDLFEKDQEFDSVLEPEAQELSKIRNHLEHKGFKIVSDYFDYPSFYDREKDISYCIKRKDFESKTLHLLKLSRAAIIYLSLAIYKEESGKDRTDLKVIQTPIREQQHKHKI